MLNSLHGLSVCMPCMGALYGVPYVTSLYGLKDRVTACACVVHEAVEHLHEAVHLAIPYAPASYTRQWSTYTRQYT
jgi:hypothetical protein